MIENDKAITAGDLVKTIQDEFKDSDQPVTVRDIAGLYGLIATQHEATLAVYALAMKANPSLIFSDQAAEAQRAILQTSETFRTATMSLYNLVNPGADHDE